MKHWILLTSLVFTLSSAANASQTPSELAMAYQEQLNAGNTEQALNYWQPQKAAQFKKDNGNLLLQLFGSIEIIKESISSSCDGSSCTVSAQFKNNDNDLQQIIYTFSGVDNLKLSKVHTQGL